MSGRPFWLRSRPFVGGVPLPALIDLTTGTLPTGVTAVANSSDNVWRQTGRATAAVFTPGGALYEMIDDPNAPADGELGLWSYGTFQNRIGTDGALGPSYVTNAVAWDRLGGFPSLSSNSLVPPTGVGLTAGSTGDNNVATWQGRQLTPAVLVGQGIASSTIWLRGNASGPNGLPTQRGMMQALASPPNQTITNVLSTDWRRYLGRGTGSQPYCEYRMSGFPLLQIGTGADVADLGDNGGWGGAANVRAGGIAVLSQLPLTDGTLTAQLPTVAGAQLSGGIAGGVIDLAVTYRLPFQLCGDVMQTAATEWNVFSLALAAGVTARLYWVYASAFGEPSSYKLVWEVVDGGTTDRVFKASVIPGPTSTDGIVGGGLGAECYTRVWHDYASGTMGFWLASAGAYFSPPTETTPAVSTVGAPTTMYLGSNAGSATGILDATHTRIQGMIGQSREVNSIGQEGAYFGDSTTAFYTAGITYPGVKSPACAWIYTYAESRRLGGGGRRGIQNFAVSGATIATQLAIWSAWQGAKSDISWAVGTLGINDVTPGVKTSAQILAEITAFIAQLRADSPGIIVVWSLMTPAAGYIATLGGSAAAIQATYNAVQAGIEANTIGADGIVTDSYYALTNVAAAAGDYTVIMSDGTGTRLAFDGGDGIHPNWLARPIIGQAQRVGLTSAGALP